MRRIALLLASTALAVLLASGVVLADTFVANEDEGSALGPASASEASPPAGHVWASGLGGFRLGDGSINGEDAIPIPVADLGGGVTEVSAGANHSVAVKDDGTVWAWGSDSYGVLGDGAASAKGGTPVRVSCC